MNDGGADQGQDGRQATPVGGEQRRLERAPGERYATGGGSGPASAGTPPDARGRRAVLAAVIAADACALLFLALAQVDLGLGLVAVAAFAGWLTGVALIWWGRDAVPVATTRMAVAAAIGASSVVIALALDWIWALAQGGALGPLDYVAQRFGLVAPLAIAAAAGVAALRAR